MLRRLRYHSSLRRARSALLAGDVQAARTAARDAFQQQRTLRAAAVFAGLRLSPGLLAAIHPAKNRVAERATASTIPDVMSAPRGGPHPAGVGGPTHTSGSRAVTETAAGLGGVLKRGAAMSAVGLVIAQAATVVQTLVLGRLLGPEEVGVFTAGSVLIGFLVVFAEGALSQALIHRKTDVEDAANTVLVVTFGTGLLGGLAVLAASPLIGTLFHSSRVGLIAAATSGLMVLHVCVERPGCADAARISVQTADDHHPGGIDRVRGCLDRVRASRDTARGQWSSDGTHQPPPRWC